VGEGMGHGQPERSELAAVEAHAVNGGIAVFAQHPHQALGSPHLVLEDLQDQVGHGSGALRGREHVGHVTHENRLAGSFLQFGVHRPKIPQQLRRTRVRLQNLRPGFHGRVHLGPRLPHRGLEGLLVGRRDRVDGHALKA